MLSDMSGQIGLDPEVTHLSRAGFLIGSDQMVMFVVLFAASAGGAARPHGTGNVGASNISGTSCYAGLCVSFKGSRKQYGHLTLPRSGDSPFSRRCQQRLRSGNSLSVSEVATVPVYPQKISRVRLASLRGGLGGCALQTSPPLAVDQIRADT